ncbi:hypothetical protein GCM10010211_17150 [Streptomyces albospinus]|uniref:Uncharacterized protein n=1 Tax=Streptomyces albospinus TaxID=285515 RepID=A0ABQ2UV53_9ACTN|nr:hypothetical protein GCM10010211_17150 [Streptomyces albospinus]
MLRAPGTATCVSWGSGSFGATGADWVAAGVARFGATLPGVRENKSVGIGYGAHNVI